jgi:hypothetical protein
MPLRGSRPSFANRDAGHSTGSDQGVDVILERPPGGEVQPGPLGQDDWQFTGSPAVGKIIGWARSWGATTDSHRTSKKLWLCRLQRRAERRSLRLADVPGWLLVALQYSISPSFSTSGTRSARRRFGSFEHGQILPGKDSRLSAKARLTQGSAVRRCVVSSLPPHDAGVVAMQTLPRRAREPSRHESLALFDL